MPLHQNPLSTELKFSIWTSLDSDHYYADKPYPIKPAPFPSNTAQVLKAKRNDSSFES